MPDPGHERIRLYYLAWHRDDFLKNALSDYPTITNVNDGSCLIANHQERPCPWLKSNYLLYQQTWK